jgi:hypothetical protein
VCSVESPVQTGPPKTGAGDRSDRAYAVPRLIVPFHDRIERLDPELAAEIERAATVVLNGKSG